MDYKSVFVQAYFKKHSDVLCLKRERDHGDCAAESVIDHLLKGVYGSELEHSACESSMSLVSRPDPFFGAFKQRATRQVFLFDTAFPHDHTKSFIGVLAVRCPSKPERKEISRLGRSESALRCAMGYLAPPRHMMREGYVIPLLDYYSVHGGLIPFLCTPYMSHDRFFGYVCAQAAVYLALEMTLPLESTPHSPATLSHILAEEANYPIGPDPRQGEGIIKYCQHHVPAETKRGRGKNPPEGFYFRGLTAVELEYLLNSDHLNTNCLALNIDSECPDITEEQLILHIKSMLHSRIPVIALVDYNALSKAIKGRDFVVTSQIAHVITIIGYRAPAPHRKFRIVFHDGHHGPYRELAIDDFMSVAKAGAEPPKVSSQSPDQEDADSLGYIKLFSPIPRNVSAKGYLSLFDSQHEPVCFKDCQPVMQLCSLGQLPKYLSMYSPGRQVKFESPNGLSNDKILEKLTGFGPDYPVWLVEYRRIVTPDSPYYHLGKKIALPALSDKSQPRLEVMIDIFDTGEGIDRRLGAVYLGVNPEDSPWIFLQVPDDRQKAWHYVNAMSQEFAHDWNPWPIKHQ